MCGTKAPLWPSGQDITEVMVSFTSVINQPQRSCGRGLLGHCCHPLPGQMPFLALTLKAKLLHYYEKQFLLYPLAATKVAVPKQCFKYRLWEREWSLLALDVFSAHISIYVGWNNIKRQCAVDWSLPPVAVCRTLILVASKCSFYSGFSGFFDPPVEFAAEEGANRLRWNRKMCGEEAGSRWLAVRGSQWHRRTKGLTSLCSSASSQCTTGINSH